MDKFIGYLLKHKKTMLSFFIIATAVSMLASLGVRVNYNIMDYLPDEAPSTIALDVMNKEYTSGTPNARVMVRNVTVSEALEYKSRLKKVKGVSAASWLDDSVNVYQPLEFAQQKTVEEYYKNNNALFTLTIDEDLQEQAVDDIYEVVGDRGALSGNAINTVTAIEMTTKEIQKIMVFSVILVFIILMFTTTSWFEPVMFLITIGVAIMINRGTNLFFGEISFVTNAAGSILQLAVSMDYSIFLLHRFSEFRGQCDNVTDAMVMAIKKSFGSIMSSGLTTVMGFAALILMRFKIGPDMGIIMAKAIAISLISVMMFLPVLTLFCYKLIDKTQHKLFIPPFAKFGSFVLKYKVVILIIFVVVTLPSILAQKNNSFTYGQSGIYGAGTRLGDDTAEIEETFGKSNLMVLMVPKGKISEEKALSDELMLEDRITSVISYAESVGPQIPEEFVPEDTAKELISDKYSRFVITVDADTEGKTAFKMVETIKNIAGKHYGADYLFLGETVNSYDMKEVVTVDNEWVNIVAIGSIALILLLNFKSLSIPVILLFVIESSIWINLGVPYFSGETLFYIGYLIISSIQLGATVDYAILFADRYNENRENMKSNEAAAQTLTDTSLSILTSASILTFAGLLLGMISSNGIISQLGILVGRGAVLSGVLVLMVLPSLLVMCDGIIHKTTYKLKYYKEEKSVSKKGSDVL